MSEPVGIVLLRPSWSPRAEPFYHHLISGIEEALMADSIPLLLQVVPDFEAEVETYRHWHESNAVSSVVVKDLLQDDPRIPLLKSLGLPMVILGDVSQSGDFSGVRTDNAQTMRDALAHLVSLGHRTIARVSGPVEYVHTQVRTAEFLAGIESSHAEGLLERADYTEEGAVAATARLLVADKRPTAIVYDNDVMAVGGLIAAGRAGLSVPSDLSILAWDDSTVCQLADPPLSALSNDVNAIGYQVGMCLLQTLQTGASVALRSPQPVVVQRGSTSAPANHG